jgi:hypothetical protein
MVSPRASFGRSGEQRNIFPLPGIKSTIPQPFSLLFRRCHDEVWQRVLVMLHIVNVNQNSRLIAALLPRAPACYQNVVDCVWNVMAHAQKPDLVFRRNGRVHLNRRGRQFSRLLAAEVFASAVVMLDTPCVRGSVKNTGYPLHSPVSPSLPLPLSPCAITFQLDSTRVYERQLLWLDCVVEVTRSFVISALFGGGGVRGQI